MNLLTLIYTYLLVLQDSNMSKVDLGLDFQGNNGENSQNSDELVGGPWTKNLGIIISLGLESYIHIDM